MAQDKVLLKISSSNGFSLQTSVIREAIRVNKSAVFAQQTIPNRSSPVITFSNGNAMTVDMTLEFKTVTDNLTTQDLNNLAKAFTSLAFPVSSGINPPPVCTITVGQNTLLNNFKCVCTNVSTSLGEDLMWDSNGNPMCLSIALNFMGIELEAQDASDFAGNSIQAYKNLSFN